MSSPSEAPAGGDISRLTDHLFRQEAGKLVSVLTGIFGIERLQLAEDVVQEALARALQTWPYYGVPKNPAAWLTQTAKNLALDVVRREKRFREKQPEIVTFIEQLPGNADDASLLDDEIKDGRLRLMFACCHPLIPHEAQAALALKTLCGFSPAEIGSAFLTTEAAAAKRLTRARRKILEQRIPFEIPSGPDLNERLAGVRQTIYLLFNEGYKASSGTSLVREDLCREAIRLATLLASHPCGNDAGTHALLALMYLNAARLAGRTDATGLILQLAEQDRSTWDRTMIARGIRHLGAASTGDSLTEYHLQAGIAACHCLAETFEQTDWPRILAHYDEWVRINHSPVVALNRAVAVASVRGPQAGLDAVEAIPDPGALKSYYLFYAVRGELESRQGHFPAAAAHFHKAAELAEAVSERAFLRKRLGECEQSGG